MPAQDQVFIGRRSAWMRRIMAHEADRVDGMEPEPAQGADVSPARLVVAGVAL
jgi:hypothetical protein